MKHLIDLLKGTGVPLQTGDIASLHKGSFTIVGGSSKLETALKAIKKDVGFNLIFLPNCISFEISLNSFNPLLLVNSLQTRLGSSKILTKGRNKKSNRYLAYMYLSLARAKASGNNDKYWRTASTLLVCSHSYLIAMLHKNNKRLYREYTAKRLLQLITSINKLRGLTSLTRSGRKDLNQMYGNMTQFIEYSRTYLPKGETWRPLGVPKLKFRVFLGMILLPLTGFIPIAADQHGGVPRRGTLTAWTWLLSKGLTGFRTIFEFDLKQFFPSVNASHVSDLLHRRGIPKAITDHLFNLNLSYAKVETLDESKLDETVALHKAELDDLGLLFGQPKEFLMRYAPGGVYTGKVLVHIVNLLKEETPESPSPQSTIHPLGPELSQEDIRVLENKLSFNRQKDMWMQLENVLARLIKLYTSSDMPEYQHSSLISMLESIQSFPESVQSVSFDHFVKSLPMTLKYSNYQRSVLKTILDCRANDYEYIDPTIVKIYEAMKDGSYYDFTVPQGPGLVYLSVWDTVSGSNKIYSIHSLSATQRGSFSKAIYGSILESPTAQEQSRAIPMVTITNLVYHIISSVFGYSVSEIKSNYWSSLYEFYQIQSALFETFAPQLPENQDDSLVSQEKRGTSNEPSYKAVIEDSVKGLPQGSPISPFLSIVLFEDVLEKLLSDSSQLLQYGLIRILRYVDDGLILTNMSGTELTSWVEHVFAPKLAQYGITYHPGKSGLVKDSGIWLKPLKFLGLVYDGSNNLFQSSTRSGRSMTYHWHDLTAMTRLVRLIELGEYYHPLYTAVAKTADQAKDTYASHLLLLKLMYEQLLETKGQLHYFNVLKLMNLGNRSSVIRFVKSSELIRNTSARLNKLSPKFGKFVSELSEFITVPSYKVHENLSGISFDSVFGGLLQARMYYGSGVINSFNTPSGSQDFRFVYERGTLAHILKSLLGDKVTVFNGTTLASRELLRWSQYSVLSNRRKLRLLPVRDAFHNFSPSESEIV